MDAYNLLPPPARISISRFPEGVRGHLLDFTLSPAPADALRQWTRSLYYPDLSRVWIHVYVTTALLSCLFLFIYTCIFFPRLLNHSFWLIRVVRRPSGVLLVPNSMMGFTIWTSAFGVLLLAWQYMMHRWFLLNKGSPDLFWMFTLCIWTPLFSARYRSCEKVITLNLFGLGLPVVQAASIIIPAVLCHFKYISSLNAYHAWATKYASQTELSTEILVEAQRCWYSLFPVFQLAYITFTLWFAWAMLEFITYTFLSVRLARVLSRQLLLLRKKADGGHDITTMSLVVPKLGNPFKYRFANDNAPDGMDAPGATESFFPPVKATRIVRKQGTRPQASQTERKITHLTTVLYHVLVQLIGIAPTTMTFGCVALYLGIKLRQDIESPATVWNSTAVTGIIAVSYTSVIAGVIVLFSIAKRGQRSYEPVLHFKGYGGSDEAKPVRKGPVGRITGLALAGITGFEGNSDSSGQGATQTSFFESESIARPPVASFALGSRNAHARRGSYHEMKDLERADQQSLEPPRTLSRRFSQTIVLTEDPDEGLVDLEDSKSKHSDDSRLKSDSLPSTTTSLRFLGQPSSPMDTSRQNSSPIKL